MYDTSQRPVTLYAFTSVVSFPSVLPFKHLFSFEEFMIFSPEGGNGF